MIARACTRTRSCAHARTHAHTHARTHVRTHSSKHSHKRTYIHNAHLTRYAIMLYIILIKGEHIFFTRGYFFLICYNMMESRLTGGREGAGGCVCGCMCVGASTLPSKDRRFRNWRSRHVERRKGRVSQTLLVQCTYNRDCHCVMQHE